MSISVATINVNGIRAAYRKGMKQWVEEFQPAVLLLQEVRAPRQAALDLVGPHYQGEVVECQIKGRAGVAALVRRDVAAVQEVVTGAYLHESEVDSGRWVEVVAEVAGQKVRFVSTYLHSGELGTPKQEAKMAHLEKVSERLAVLAKDPIPTVVAGDFNIVHTPQDIKNWKPNHNKRAGVLDAEIAYLDRWFSAGWVDVTRQLLPQQQGPYTWWSWRGKAFDNDAGWRIDYQMATPPLAEKATGQRVHRAENYDQRFSDHAPLVVTYQL